MRNTNIGYEIQVEGGIIRGSRCGDPQMVVFRGIPYAAPPVGELRFMEPQPVKKWDGILDCTAFRPTAVMPDMKDSFYQQEFHLYPMDASEDCLYLNIWTPAKTSKDKLPVMFWIHGGGNFQGYSHEMEFDGETLCKRDVILVTIGYRLSVLGFLAHPELSERNPHRVSGQLGLLDQMAALEWVRRNIAAFGGDPECITIFGQSAGGGDTLAFLASPMARGKFQRAIVMSGFFFTEGWQAKPIHQAEAHGKRICEELGLSVQDLLTMDAQKLTDRFYFDENGNRANTGFNSMGYIDDQYFLNKLPAAALMSGDVNPVPLMIGTVFGDANLFRWDGAEPKVGETVGYSVAAAEARLCSGLTPAYTYCFDRNLPGNEECPPNHAYHSSDLWYVFGTLGRSRRPMTGRDFDLANEVMDYWTNFAKMGNPNGGNRPQWNAYTKETPHVMVFGDERSELIDFSEDLRCEENRKKAWDSYRNALK